ncbi:MAG: hypothetical protein DRJ10_13420 [Bacteroidetes bacterium]|nr:MAG: hypothetical protein DRJ10_13420 [Bacteroidota bacterium]
MGCTGVGMLDDIPKITVGKAHIAPGSKLICYTDGIVELENDNKEQFGTDFMEECMIQTKSINIIIDEIIEKFSTHKGDNDYFDDISLMGIEFH